jgi:hypothetical protein
MDFPLRNAACALLTGVAIWFSACSRDSAKPNAPAKAPETTVGSSIKGGVFQTGEACTLSWNPADFPGDNVIIQLYLDTNILFQYGSASVSSGRFIIPCLTSSMGPDTGYRFRIMAFSDPGTGQFSAPFALVSSYDGLFALVSPDAHSNWTAGQTYDIRWTLTANPGKHANLLLYQNTALLLTIAGGIPAPDGLCAWSVPATGLFNGTYQIKIVSVEDPRYSSWSAPYLMSGFH